VSDKGQDTMLAGGRRHQRLAVAALLAVLTLAALGSQARGAGQAQITVYAAASLTDVFPRIDPNQRYSFGGSNTLAAQIQQGAPADVFASANMTLPNQLFASDACSNPVVFTRNALVVVVPRSNPAGIRTVYDLTKPGVRIVVAGAGVPVGSYTLQILRNMNLSAGVLRNVVSRETDVREVLSKVALGEADAGFVYSTDAKAASGRITVVRLPAWAQPKVQYGMCIVASSTHRPDAQAFLNKVLGRAGQAKLIAAGFLPRVEPPRK
jgi:molybdate transport system substrate-binding protein